MLGDRTKLLRHTIMHECINANDRGRTTPYAGREMWLTDVKGKVVKDIIA
jgi:hypothetical protein